jgi:hypothetical protein
VPQAAVGAMARQRTIVIGDPMEFSFVVTLPSLIRSIFREFKVNTEVGCPEMSAQTLATG